MSVSTHDLNGRAIGDQKPRLVKIKGFDLTVMTHEWHEGVAQITISFPAYNFGKEMGYVPI